MVTHRVTISDKIIKQLRDTYNNRIKQEFGFVPSDSIITNIALLEFKAMKEDNELEIKFNKNGKIKYKFK